MKTKLMLIVGLNVFFTSVIFAQNKFVGAAKCKMCHNAADKGAQYIKWSQSKHAKALEALKSDEAKKIAKNKGIANPLIDAKCLKCHSTDFGAAANLKDGITANEGVSCESCHGAGSAFKTMSVMKNLADAKSKGLIIPNEKVCIKCHNAESPTFKSFDFKTYSAKIAHKNPKK